MKLTRFECRIAEDYNNYHLDGKIIMSIKNIIFRGVILSGDNNYSFQYSEKEEIKLRINVKDALIKEELESLITRVVTQVKNIVNYPFTEL